MIKIPLLKWAVALCFNLILIPGLWAQDHGGGSPASAETQIEEITVTARKREENSQKIPQSISVFTRKQIEDTGISDVADISLLTPNVHMKQGASTNLVIIRGISNDADFIHSTTGLYIDDVAYSLNFMHNPTLFDIERIEVLRGPQGTLYGKNSESGVVNIITRKPGNQVAGKVFTEIGAYDPEHGSAMSYRAGLNLSGPIVPDRFFMSIAGEYETSDGYILNSYTGNDRAAEIDHKNGRLKALWTPSDRLDISMTADVTDISDGNGNKRYNEGVWKTDPHEIRYDADNNIIEQSGNGQTLKVEFQADSFNLLSITGRRYYKNHMLRDADLRSTDAGVNDLFYSSDMISQEFRVLSPEDNGPVHWLGGIYLFREENDTDLDMPTLKTVRNTDVESLGYALFGQGTLTLFERLHLTAGLRYGVDDQDASMRYTDAATTTFEKSIDESVLLPKFSVGYDIRPGMMAYATVSRGYNAGGFNTAYATGTDNFSYDAEYTWNYELGLKSAWFDNRLTANLALFYISIDDKQVAEYDGVTDSTYILNAAQAHSQGFEFEVHARPVRGLDLFGGIGFTKVVFDKWDTDDGDYADKDFPNAPEITANIGAQYRHSSGFMGRIDVSVSDGYYSDAANTQWLGGKTLVGLRAGYEAENYDIMLWCKNLFNQDYQTIGFARKFDQVVDGAPRMFGVTLTYYF
jgi:iron complex outermembrane receptor protein